MRFDNITPQERKRDNESWFSKQFNAFVDDFDIVAMNCPFDLQFLRWDFS